MWPGWPEIQGVLKQAAIEERQWSEKREQPESIEQTMASLLAGRESPP